MQKITFFWITVCCVSIISTIAVVSLIFNLYFVLTRSEGATEVVSEVTIYLFFLRLTGTLAFIFIGIATSLGALRNVIFSFYKNSQFWKIHTRIASTLGVGFGVSHFIVYLMYQNRLENPLSLSLFTPNLSRLTATSTLIFFSSLALLIFIMNVTISNIPKLKAQKWWKPLHILNFLGFFLVLIHAFYIGTNSSGIIYKLLYGIFTLLALSGLLHRSFKFASKGTNTGTVEKAPQEQNSVSVTNEVPAMKISNIQPQQQPLENQSNEVQGLVQKK